MKQAPHPGEAVLSRLKEQQRTVLDIADHCGLPLDIINEIVAQRRYPTPMQATAIGVFLGRGKQWLYKVTEAHRLENA